jgi:hypothetical protein
MLIGQSAFQSVLTRLKEEEEENGAEPQPDAFRINGLASGFVAEAADQATMSGGAAERASAYFETAADAERQDDRMPGTPAWPEPTIFAEVVSDIDDEPRAFANTPYSDEFAPPRPRKQPMPAHLLRLSEDEIAADLAITDDDNEATLTEKRRRFARSNHPDSVGPQWLAQATTRMKIANLMIDAAIARLRRR